MLYNKHINEHLLEIKLLKNKRNEIYKDFRELTVKRETQKYIKILMSEAQETDRPGAKNNDMK